MSDEEPRSGVVGEAKLSGTGGHSPALARQGQREVAGARRPFHQAILRLYEGQGEPATRAIARRVEGRISHTTVYEVLRGNVLPKWETAEVLIEALGGGPVTFRRLWAQERRLRREDRTQGASSPVPPAPATVDVVGLAGALRGIVAELDTYIERRAQEIAAPRIEAAELACDEEMAEVLDRESTRIQRHKDLVAELRRQIGWGVRAQEKLLRVRRYADTLESEEAGRLRGLLNSVASTGS